MATVIILRAHYVEVPVPFGRVDAFPVVEHLRLSLTPRIASSVVTFWRLHFLDLRRTYVGCTLVDFGVALECVSWRRRDEVLG